MRLFFIFVCNFKHNFTKQDVSLLVPVKKVKRHLYSFRYARGVLSSLIGLFLKTDKKKTDGYNWSKKLTFQRGYLICPSYMSVMIRNLSVKWTSEIFSITRREISYLQAAMYCFFFLYINTNEIPKYSALTSFGRERCDLLCSHSNGDLYKSEDQYQVYAQKLTWYFIGGYVIIYFLLL